MYKHLTREQRYQIQTYLQCGKSIKFIAENLNVNKTTIYRELKRNASSSSVYIAEDADTKSEKRKQRYRCYRRFNDEVKAFIDDKLKYKWSPEQIVGYCKRHGKMMVSHERIYQYIREDKMNKGHLFKSCRHMLKHRKRVLGGKRNIILNKVSIEQRPSIINNKERFGDWEIDTIIGENRKGAIVTIVERTTGFLLMKKLENGKNAKELAKAVIKMLLPYKHMVHSITSDNGTEFAEHQLIAKKLKTNFYFAHPYASWERGINEYTNKLVRQYIPKSMNFNLVFERYIQFVNKQINDRPRKKLNYYSPYEIFSKFTA
jgi:IS30 family transposase